MDIKGNNVPGRGTSKCKGPEASILALLEEQHRGQCGWSRGRRGRKEMQQRGNGDPITWALEDIVVILSHLTESGGNPWKVKSKVAAVIYGPLFR